MFAESISDAGVHASFGTVQLEGEKRGCCRAGVKELEGRRQKTVCSFVGI